MAVHEELPADADAAAIEQLHSIRESIDNIDAALIHLLAERFKFTQQVGRLKAAHGLPAADPARELMQIDRLRGLAEEAHLDPAFAEKFLNFIIAEVIHHHVKIAGGEAAQPPTPATGAAPTGAVSHPVPHPPTAHAPSAAL
ncbi:MAG: chorismate mutase [Cryobacterium sp.]|uniref:chorismate mutase n=1 Tax=unclassified Cryobacterium TaxID=2649013 RepID=UPI0018C9453B|nr:MULTISPECIES: chorismate mutase [unclassified Cryobacterium]MCY7404683.1 chorismate mutase [Cryobacterium sp.]MEC5154957.1 chorismate mutase [Cryobacterium sp. CAN_C3]